MNLTQLLSLAVFAVFAENLVLTKFLGVDLFLHAPKKMGTVLGMGLTVTVVMGLSALCAWVVNTFLLAPFGLDSWLRIVVFILIIAGVVQLLGMLLKKVLPTLHATLSEHLPLITTNCAVLGAVLQNTRNGYGALTSAAYGVFGGLGFTLALLLFTSLRERLEFAECPKAFEGFPLTLVTAGLLAMSFLGFTGLRFG